MPLLLNFPSIPLLRLSWLAATIPILAAFVSEPVRQTLTLFSSRGKTLASPRSLTVPHSYFLHFYILASSLTASLLIPTWLFAASEKGSDGPSSSWRSVFCLVLMEVQVVRRLYETVKVFDYGGSARMHVLGYFTGLFFYTAAPLSLSGRYAQEALSHAGGQIYEFMVKGQERMPVIEFNVLLRPLLNLDWYQWLGSAIFIWGWIHQLHCHVILGSLRKHKGDDEYAIPYGDWFEYVSCPHYLAEIVVYAGILVASGGSDITIWLLFLFVVANLAFAAAETHRWYLNKFESYPKLRRAIIPFVY